MVVCQPDDLKEWDPEKYSGLIYDEGSLAHLPEPFQIHHLQLEQNVRVKARFRDAWLTAGRRAILTTNFNPDQVMKYDHPAIRRRVRVVDVPERNRYIVWPENSPSRDHPRRSYDQDPADLPPRNPIHVS